MAISRYERIAATVGKNLYQEQLEKIGQVSIPHQTARDLITSDVPTPNVPQKEVTWGIPTAFEDPLGTLWGAASIIKGSRENVVSTATKLMPFDIKITETTAPEYNAFITDVPQKLNMDLFKGKIISVPTAVLPKDVSKDNVYQVTAADYPVTQDTVAINKYFQDLIDLQKSQNEKYREFWEGNQYGLPFIQLPEINIPEFPDPFGGIKDAAKWILIGGAVLIGIYLVAKAFGGSKSSAAAPIIVGGLK